MTSTPTHSQRKRLNVHGPTEASIAPTIIQVPAELELGVEIDYAKISNIDKKFWTECQSSFVFGVDEKHKLHID